MTSDANILAIKKLAQRKLTLSDVGNDAVLLLPRPVLVASSPLLSLADHAQHTSYFNKPAAVEDNW